MVFIFLCLQLLFWTKNIKWLILIVCSTVLQDWVLMWICLVCLLPASIIHGAKESYSMNHVILQQNIFFFSSLVDLKMDALTNGPSIQGINTWLKQGSCMIKSTKLSKCSTHRRGAGQSSIFQCHEYQQLEELPTYNVSKPMMFRQEFKWAKLVLIHINHKTISYSDNVFFTNLFIKMYNFVRYIGMK